LTGKLKVEKNCLRANKQNGEAIRQKLAENDFINRDYRIESDNKHVFFPLKDSIAIDSVFAIFDGEILSIIKYPVYPRPRKVSYKDRVTKIIPPDFHHLIPSSFDVIGKIAMVKMEPEIIDFKKEIGKSILSVSRIQSVYMKTDEVKGQFRLPELELIAGEPVTETIHKEHGVTVFVDIKKAFFNPRLANEHQRIASIVKEGEVVLDLFTGVGPFAILIAKNNRATVHAVDINPSAIACLEESIKLNSLKGDIVPVTGDIRNVYSSLPMGDRIIMNLPGDARSYLDVAFSKTKKGGYIHYYTFSPKNAPNPVEMVSNDLDNWLKNNGKIGTIINAFKLREVSAGKFQVAVDMQKT